MLPSAGRPRLLVPSVRRAGAAALRRYGEPGSVTAWAGSRALALALSGGAAAAAWVERLRVRVPDGADTIEAYLRTSSGTRCWSACTWARPGRTASRCCSCSPSGETAGFAKIGVNPLTSDLVRAEQAALTPRPPQS